MAKVSRNSLQSSSQALSFNLQQLMDTFNGHAQFLKEAHAYPLPNFPGHTQEALLGQLLRKKLEPRVEDWIDEHTIKHDKEEALSNGAAAATGGMTKEEMRDLWTWAGQTSSSIVRPMLDEDGAFGDDYTIAEREAGVESVVTGLRRKLDGDSEGEDQNEAGDDASEKMEDVMSSTGVLAEADAGIDPAVPTLPLESVLRFISTGTKPNNMPSNR